MVRVIVSVAYQGQGTLGGFWRSKSSEFLAAHAPELCSSLTICMRDDLCQITALVIRSLQFFPTQGHRFVCELANPFFPCEAIFVLFFFKVESRDNKGYIYDVI